MALETIKPADGSRVVRDDTHAVLFGQPPEVLKGLLLKQIRSIDTLVLTDTRERDGSLLNNLEFPLYYFLFIGKGTQSGTRLNLVGDAAEIARVLRLLQLTLLGPVQTELQRWGTPPRGCSRSGSTLPVILPSRGRMARCAVSKAFSTSLVRRPDSLRMSPVPDWRCATTAITS